MKLESGKIEPGIGIGEFKINMSKDELLDKIGLCNFLSEHIIRAENAEFYLDHKDRVYQIVVRQGFKGKFLGHIGMESTMEEIRKYAGDVKEYDAEYWNMDVACELEDYPGIRFELSKEDDYYRKKKTSVKMVIVFRNEMEIIHGKVEPGVGIGDFRINMSKDELLDKIGKFYNMVSDNIIEVGNARFWLDENNKVEAIAVGKGFEGKFLERIGRGSTLVDVQKYAGDFFEDYDTYGLKDYGGIRFELGQQGDDSYDEMKAPINEIIVFQKEKIYKTEIK